MKQTSYRTPSTELKNECTCVTYGDVGGSSAGKSRLEQQISNVKSIAERWRYFVYFLHDFESFSCPKCFIYLREIALWSLLLKLSKGKGFCLFYWPFIVHSCFTSSIFAAQTLDFKVKFGFVFRSEAVVFRRYVLALLLVGLLRKFEAYLVISLGAFHFFKNSSILLICYYGFALSSPVFPHKLMACAVVFQLCPLHRTPSHPDPPQIQMSKKLSNNK